MRTLGLALACLLVVAPISSAKDAEVFFERDVRPILKTYCFHCHGEEAKREGEFDTRLVRFLVQGGESGSALVPGKPEESLLLKRIASAEMPPKGKQPSEAEKQIIRNWIAQGARTVRPEPLEVVVESEWTDEERNYWAFQPVVRPSVPLTQDISRIRNPIDSFILSQLETQGRNFAPSGDRATLAKRLSIDLLGLPLPPERVLRFAQEDLPDAYERLVDELLASPAYGERWARHWLDPVGYADSDGYTENDRRRPWAFRYRDYVIRSLNQDKAFDEFIVEQLAGDELVPMPYESLNEEDTDRLTATGFLRTAPDGTGDVGDQNVARNEVIAETIKIVSTTLLGVTVGCAQCHLHRYDPISQEDYYRIRAVFEPALDWKNWRDQSSRQVSLWTAQDRAKAAAIDQQLREIEGQRNAALDVIVEEIFEGVVAGLDDAQKTLAREAKAAKREQLTEAQKQILKDFPRLNVDRGSAILYEPKKISDHDKKFEDLIAVARSKRPPDNFIAVLDEVPNHKPVTFRFARGDMQQPRETILPGDLSVLPSGFIPDDDPNVPTTGRRLAFARHLTSGQHPLLARTLVNRFWMHHFGRGIVPTPGDFGRLGETPTHPELLDWLADEFVRSGWRLKALHRLVVTSETYRQASHRSEYQSESENRFLDRMSVRRLDAEVLRDAMLEVSGMRTATMYGPSSPVNPNEVGQIVIGNATRDGNGIMVTKGEDTPEKFRRSIYIEIRRSMPLGILEPFDLASVTPNCDRRSSSTVAPQSLMMMNNEGVLTLSERFASRVIREVGDDPQKQVMQAWLLAFGTPASEFELREALAMVEFQREHFKKIADQTPPNGNGQAKTSAPVLSPEHQALALFCQALFSSNRFLYVD
jgi:Protein of unknown function (DUF1553)/Protein of unknown function (DUF1549)/Planctomycete cytochrome C